LWQLVVARATLKIKPIAQKKISMKQPLPLILQLIKIAYAAG